MRRLFVAASEKGFLFVAFADQDGELFVRARLGEDGFDSLEELLLSFGILVALSFFFPLLVVLVWIFEGAHFKRRAEGGLLAVLVRCGDLVGFGAFVLLDPTHARLAQTFALGDEVLGSILADQTRQFGDGIAPRHQQHL